MKRYFTYFALVAMLLSLCALPCQAGRYVEDSLKVDGHMRQFVMYLPDDLQPNAPLVVVLHGYGAGIWRENVMIGPADRHGAPETDGLRYLGIEGIENIHPHLLHHRLQVVFCMWKIFIVHTYSFRQYYLLQNSS